MELWDIHSEALSTQIEYLILYNWKDYAEAETPILSPLNAKN